MAVEVAEAVVRSTKVVEAAGEDWSTAVAVVEAVCSTPGAARWARASELARRPPVPAGAAGTRGAAAVGAGRTVR
jgi:hypothetical protein